ncbi:MAG: hypothetical protein QM808_17715 [Steroidobacteraceae bacterium]
MSATINVQAMQWADIPRMGSPDLEPFGDNDAACFKDIRDVLMKHGALKRFGVFLIHKHFEITDDEELTEGSEEEGRVLKIAPRLKSEIDPAMTIPTNWVFTETEDVAKIGCTCARNTSSHLGYHRKF